jgi:hypothetical protein
MKSPREADGLPQADAVARSNQASAAQAECGVHSLAATLARIRLLARQRRLLASRAPPRGFCSAAKLPRRQPMPLGHQFSPIRGVWRLLMPLGHQISPIRGVWRQPMPLGHHAAPDDGVWRQPMPLGHQISPIRGVWRQPMPLGHHAALALVRRFSGRARRHPPARAGRR